LPGKLPGNDFWRGWPKVVTLAFDRLGFILLKRMNRL
jgi:hypothetical protein